MSIERESMSGVEPPSARASGPAFQPPKGQPDTLAQYIQELIALNREGEFVEIDRYGRRHSTRYGELFERSKLILNAVRRSDSSDQRIVVLVFDSVRDYVAAAWACLFAGRDFLPWETSGIFTNPHEFSLKLRNALNELGAPIVVADNTVCRALEQRKRILPVPLINIGEIVPTPGDGVAPTAAPATRSRLLILTSGTGGDPKIAIIENDALMNRFFDGIQRDHRVCLYNLAHSSVGGVRLLLPLGERVIYFHSLRIAANPEDWLKTVAEFSVTDIGMSTSMASMLCPAVEAAAGISMASVERISFGAEVIVPEVIRRLLLASVSRGASNVMVAFVYSMTETGPLYRSILPLAEALSELAGTSEPIALRNCVAGWDVRCMDAGRPASEGTPGTIQVFSEHKLFSGYYGEPPLRRMAGAEDRWFNTGDIGVFRDGKLTLKGREKSTIIVHGRKLTCEEIEARLAQTESLKDTTIIVAPFRDERHVTDEIVIFFIPTIDDQAAILGLARSVVAAVSSYFRLTARHVVPIRAQDVERTATIKVKRDSLLLKYKEGIFKNLSDIRQAVANTIDSEDDIELLRLWQGALELSYPPQMEDSFFDLGGDSLGAIRLISSVEREYSAHIEIHAFFEQPTPSRMLALLQPNMDQSIADVVRRVPNGNSNVLRTIEPPGNPSIPGGPLKSISPSVRTSGLVSSLLRFASAILAGSDGGSRAPLASVGRREYRAGRRKRKKDTNRTSPRRDA